MPKAATPISELILIFLGGIRSVALMDSMQSRKIWSFLAVHDISFSLLPWALSSSSLRLETKPKCLHLAITP